MRNRTTETGIQSIAHQSTAKDYDGTHTSEQLENLRHLLYSAWTAAGEMTHNQSCIESIGQDEYYRQKLKRATGALKSAWLAIEATGIMPAIFATAAAQDINVFSTTLKKEVANG